MEAPPSGHQGATSAPGHNMSHAMVLHTFVDEEPHAEKV